jgi:hypothetical protein
LTHRDGSDGRCIQSAPGLMPFLPSQVRHFPPAHFPHDIETRAWDSHDIKMIFLPCFIYFFFGRFLQMISVLGGQALLCVGQSNLVWCIQSMTLRVCGVLAGHDDLLVAISTGIVHNSTEVGNVDR